jgi:hypothetical protein
MTRGTVGCLGLALLLAACARPKESADTTSVLAIDTLKPATTALQSPDTTSSADRSAATKTSAGTKTKGARDTSTKQSGTKELGRDSIIRIDTKDKRRQLPLADTTKKP